MVTVILVTVVIFGHTLNARLVEQNYILRWAVSLQTLTSSLVKTRPGIKR